MKTMEKTHEHDRKISQHYVLQGAVRVEITTGFGPSSDRRPNWRKSFVRCVIL